jgi:hypothetical protein
VTSFQSLWPFMVVVSCLCHPGSRPGRDDPEETGSRR